MIEKIKRNLVWRYTCIIFAVSTLVFIGCDGIYHYVVQHTLEENLLDYLHEECREAQGYNSSFHEEVHSYVVDANMIQSFSYWVLNNKVIHAAQPAGVVGKELLQEIENWQHPNIEIKYIKIKHNHDEWNFAAASKDFTLHGQNGKIIVVMNLTPIEKFSENYLQYGILILLAICVLSYFIARNLANRAISPIVKMYNNQKEFVSNASHELKTPLGVLMAYSELVEAKCGKNEDIKVIKDEVKNMSALIENLLILSRLDNPKAQEEISILNISTEIKEIVNKFNQMSRDRKFPVSIEEEENVCALISKTDLHRIMNILLENAIKYTSKEKKIAVKVYIKNKKICIDVKDEGVGIKEKDLPHIFERFYRADVSHNRKVSGYGLGLSIAFKIVEKYHGQIRVESQVGKGSTFKIEFPSA